MDSAPLILAVSLVLAAAGQNATVTDAAVGCRDRDDLVLFVQQTAEAAGDPSEVLAQALVLSVLKDRGRCRSFEKGDAVTIHERNTARIARKPVPLAQVSETGSTTRKWWILADHLEQ